MLVHSSFLFIFYAILSFESNTSVLSMHPCILNYDTKTKNKKNKKESPFLDSLPTGTSNNYTGAIASKYFYKFGTVWASDFSKKCSISHVNILLFFTRGELITGKSQTEALMYWPRDSEAEVWDFPAKTELVVDEVNKLFIKWPLFSIFTRPVGNNSSQQGIREKIS